MPGGPDTPTATGVLLLLRGAAPPRLRAESRREAEHGALNASRHMRRNLRVRVTLTLTLTPNSNTNGARCFTAYAPESACNSNRVLLESHALQP